MKGQSFMPRPLRWASLSIVLLAGAFGCGSSANPAIKVSGVVTLEGAPVEGAKVIYYPSSGAAPPMGVTDNAGKFELSTFDMKTLKLTDGALPDEYKVTVEIPPPSAGRNPGSPDGLKQAREREMMSAFKGARKMKEPQVVHPNYGDVSKTPLKQVVPPQGAVELKLNKNGT
jgi:hypothetical protein